MAARSSHLAAVFWTCLLALCAAVAALSTDKPTVVAHRGASGTLPEHTKEAYLLAIQQGADFIECDVVVTKDLQLICRHEPQLNDTTDAAQKFKDRSTTYLIDGTNVTGVFASDLTLAEVRTLRANERLPFRNQSNNGKFGIPTFEEYIDIALGAGRPVGIYPESKHPAWHNSLPALKAAGKTIEQLIVDVLNRKGYATSAPYGNTAWLAKPVILQSFEINSVKRFSELTPVPLAYLLDDAPDPETGKPIAELVSDSYLTTIKPFVTIMAPWKGLLYKVSGQQGQQQKLESTGLTGRFKNKGFVVHTYTIRNEPQYIIPTCGGDINCEFNFLFKSEGLNGAFDDYPGTFAQWVQKNYS